MVSLADIAKKAKEAIDKLGVEISLVEDDWTYDPDTGAVTGSGTTHTAIGTPVFDDERRLSGASGADRAVAKVILPAKDLEFEPLPGWKATVGGAEYAVTRVEKIPASGVPSVFVLALER